MAATLPVRRRIRIGPALRIVRLPMASLTLSTGLHLGLMVAIVLAVHAINRHPAETYVVNLVPAVAAIGAPRGEASAPPQTAPSPPIPSPRTPAAKTDLPDRAPALPSRDLPARMASRDPMSLPERGALPARTTTPALPRPDQKELPALPTGSTPTQGTPVPAASVQSKSTTPAPQAAATPPPQPLGQATGSPKGAGKLTLNVTDFPFAWYWAAIIRKVGERWDDKALPGDNQPIVVFEIDRDGQVNMNSFTVEKSSGNPLYDRVAIRAIQDANPFPPLPAEFKKPSLRVHLGFHYSRS